VSSQERQSCRERHHDDLAAYALGALPGQDAAELERHLATCSACSERLRWLQPAVDLVPATVRQLEPPPELRESLMAVVHEEAAAEAAPAERPQSRERGFFAWLRLPALGPMRPALAGVAVLLVLLAGVGGYVLGTDGDAGGPGESFVVTSLQPGVAASGELEVHDDSATLTVQGLPPIGGDEVYQVWTVQGNKQPRSASIFVPEGNGRASAAIPNLPADADQVVVTREPAGGSEVATTAPVLQSSLR